MSAATTKKSLAVHITERDFMATVIELAMVLGYSVYHTHDSRRSEPGFPDLVLVRVTDRRLIFAEVKTDKGRVSQAQAAWLDALWFATGGHAYVWRPSQWDHIVEVLGGNATSGAACGSDRLHGESAVPPVRSANA